MPYAVDSGLPCVGRVPWGTHFCQFYENGTDLLDTLVPYFKAGLDNNECCLWVADEPLGAEAATSALRAAVPDLDNRIRQGQIEIIDHRDWYSRKGRFDADEVFHAWISRKEEALARGYAGLRLTGNTFWLEDGPTFKNFMDYESRVNETFRQHRIVCMCSYCLGKSHATGVLDVVRSHEFAVVRRDGMWEVVESAALKIAKAELRRANENLERRVAERTAALEETMADLRSAMTRLEAALADKEVLLREVHHRVRNNLQIICSLLNLKVRRLPDPESRTIFRDTLQRISAMALVHDALYQKEDSSFIDVSALLRALADTLLGSYGMTDRATVTIGSTGGHIDLNGAIPLALIAAEVMGNALKHAFSDGRRGQLHAAFVPGQDGEPHLLTIRDNGIGISDEALDQNRIGAGLTLVKALARQLRGRTEFRRRDGTIFTLSFSG